MTGVEKWMRLTEADGTVGVIFPIPPRGIKQIARYIAVNRTS